MPSDQSTKKEKPQKKGARNWARALGLTALGLFAVGTLIVVFGLIYVTLIHARVQQRIEQLRATRSSKFYAFFPSLAEGQKIQKAALTSLLEAAGYQALNPDARLTPKSYSWKTSEILRLMRPAFSGPGHPLRKEEFQVTFTALDGALITEEIFAVEARREVESLEFSPKQLGYFFAGRLRNQSSVPLSDIPVSLRLAFMAIEDSQFLEHHGVSLRGTVRALYKDLLAMKWVQGGSTITQQLMKNLFFSRDKVITRKLKEALYAFVAESRFEKEVILEAYLNEVYLGQWNTHEIHGVSEASQYYFSRPVFDLSVAESATLAAMVQGPGIYNPHKYPDRLLERRNVVLKKMAEVGFILDSERDQAIQSPLGIAPADRNLTDAAYFMELALQGLPPSLRDRLDEDAITVYVTLNPLLQAAASTALSEHVQRMEAYYASLKKKREAGNLLQGALVSMDIANCSVLAIQGGRNFREAPFNRALNGKRQPGSLFKPFVFLTAFSDPPADTHYNADSLLIDEPFIWEYDKKTWEPRNYDTEFRGQVTLAEALQLSLNIPTARLAQSVGLKPILKNLKSAGIESSLPAIPSLSLGSAEVTPFELANAYTTLARMGRRCIPRSYWKAFDDSGKLITESSLVETQALDPEASYETVEILKGVFATGTAQSAHQSGLRLEEFAGKTGTTNDYKDAWFVGFSPEVLTLVWVGYDSQEAVEFPGAVAALPIWTNFMKVAAPFLKGKDFERLPALDEDTSEH